MANGEAGPQLVHDPPLGIAQRMCGVVHGAGVAAALAQWRGIAGDTGLPSLERIEQPHRDRVQLMAAGRRWRLQHAKRVGGEAPRHLAVVRSGLKSVVVRFCVRFWGLGVTLHGAGVTPASGPKFPHPVKVSAEAGRTRSRVDRLGWDTVLRHVEAVGTTDWETR